MYQHYFGKIDVLPDELLKKIAEIVNLILGAGGRITLNAQDEGFMRTVRGMNIRGLSEML
jgi:hypothetical protein